MSRLGGNVLLTGASGGIGHAIARAIAPRSADLILTARRTEVLEPLAADLGARVVACDLARQVDLERLIEHAGRVDVLIANAALPASGLLLDLTQAEIDRMLEVNLRAPIALARALAPGMAERRRGHLAFVSSLSGKTASPASSVYSATKFGLRGFALGLREDLRTRDVGVSVVLPGFIREAGMFADSRATLPPGVGTRSPDEVARAVISAIDRNRAEVVVAPLSMRVGATIGGAAPMVASAVSRLLGSERIAADIAAGQRDKRT
jgi:short-subunit dehydrogenase